jgi:hypothetical protein
MQPTPQTATCGAPELRPMVAVSLPCSPLPADYGTRRLPRDDQMPATRHHPGCRARGQPHGYGGDPTPADHAAPAAARAAHPYEEPMILVVPPLGVADLP